MSIFELSPTEDQAQVVEGADQGESLLDQILRQGARRMLLNAIEAEIDDYISRS